MIYAPILPSYCALQPHIAHLSIAKTRLSEDVRRLAGIEGETGEIHLSTLSSSRGSQGSSWVQDKQCIPDFKTLNRFYILRSSSGPLSAYKPNGFNDGWSAKSSHGCQPASVVVSLKSTCHSHT